MLTRLQDTYNEFPTTFWTLMGGIFIDRLGAALLFPFFALYITAHFGVGMTEVGVVFAIFAVTGIAGSMMGGALADRFGRKGMLLFGIVTSGLSSLLMGLVDNLLWLYLIAAIVGLLSEAGGPAGQAMVADLLPEEKRAEGFGMFRVVANLAVTIGPAIGGLIAARSYMALFVIDAVASLITAAIIVVALPETKPELEENEVQLSLWQTLRGYSVPLRDGLFVAFLVASILMVTVYTQMNSTLSVYLRDVHGVPEQGFGWILSLNAAMVVLLQFWITRRVSPLPPLLVMVAGTLLYAVGFALYGFVSSYVLFLGAMVIITVGEMLVTPVAQALVARLSPAAMRGRYMALYGFSWALPVAVAPLGAGLIMDYLNPDLVWIVSGLIGLVAAAGYGWLHLRAGGRLRHDQVEEAAPVMAGSAVE